MLSFVAAVVLLCLGLASAVPVGPKSWCLTTANSGAKKNYALFPSGKCGECSFSVFGPNHCNEWIGEVCQQGGPYAIVKKNGYKYCVCNSGWYGSPKGDKLPANITVGGDTDAGCSVCPIFATTSKVGSTKATQCSICRGDLQYEGKAPFCFWNPTKFAFPNCSIPEPWQTYGVKLPGKAGCGCKAGTFGSWPDCRPCPYGLTAPAGNGNTCLCDPKQGFIRLPTKALVCECVTAKGFFPTFQNATNCVKCSKVTGSKVVNNRCGCNGAKGYGLNLAAKAASPLNSSTASVPICLKCSAVGAVLDAKTGACKCKAGFGVEIGYDPADIDYKSYCVPCKGKEYKVDSKGYCSCAGGYARTTYFSNRICLPCTGGAKTPVPSPDYPQPLCGCKPGFEGTIFAATDKCTKCGKGQFADASQLGPFGSTLDFCTCTDPNSVFKNNACDGCVQGYTLDAKTKKCKLTQACKASKWTARFWNAAAIGAWNGTFFPTQILEKKVPATKTMTLKSLGISLVNADIPGTGKFAVVLDIWLWGKKGAPLWLKQGQGRYTSSSNLLVQATGSKTLAESTEGFLPSSFFGDLSLSVVGSAATYGDSCTPIRVVWWGVKKADTALVGKLVRKQGGLGWF